MVEFISCLRRGFKCDFLTAVIFSATSNSTVISVFALAGDFESCSLCFKFYFSIRNDFCRNTCPFAEWSTFRHFVCGKCFLQLRGILYGQHVAVGHILHFVEYEVIVFEHNSEGLNFEVGSIGLVLCDGNLVRILGTIVIFPIVKIVTFFGCRAKSSFRLAIVVSASGYCSFAFVFWKNGDVKLLFVVNGNDGFVLIYNCSGGYFGSPFFEDKAISSLSFR